MPFKVNEEIICIFTGQWLEVSPGSEIAVPGPRYMEHVTVSGLAADGGLFLKEYPDTKEGYAPTSFRPLSARERAESMVQTQLVPLLNPKPQHA